MSGFDIGNRRVGDGSPCLVVAEVAQAHDGSLGAAHAYIDAVARAGADAVKFQCHIADAESWPEEEWRVTPRWPQDKTRFDYWRRMEFTEPQWGGLACHARDSGLIFLCSPFSVEAVKMMDPLVPAWKVPSGEITNEPLLHAIKATGKPVLLSSGMASMKELASAVELLDLGPGPRCKVRLLQCTSIYPCPPGKIGLRTDLSGDSYWCGLSDHSGTIYPSLAAVTLGCDILEVHVTFSKDSFGPDVSSSLDTSQLAQLVEGVRFIEKAKTPIDKDAMAKELEPMRELFLHKHKKRAAVA